MPVTYLELEEVKLNKNNIFTGGTKLRMLRLFIFAGLVAMSSVTFGATLRVPGSHSSIKKAVAAAKEGDTIIISDGTYREGEIRIDKSLTIGSRFLENGNRSHISATIIHGGGGGKGIVTNQGIGKVEIAGLTVTGASKLIQGNSELDVHHCTLLDGSDQVSFENASFGRVSDCTFEGASDDAIDSDSAVGGSGRAIEILDNDIKNCGDDGIEIRLYRRKGAPLFRITIEGNSIVNVGEDGIQFIDERAAKDNDNSRIIEVIDNLIVGCDAVGIGCMPEQMTIENFGGAPGMDEPVYVINNTIVESKYGITGGDNMVVLNCIIKDHSNTGIKRVKDQGIVDFTLFHNNGTDISGSTEGGNNIKGRDPQYNSSTYKLSSGSFSIDRGTDFYRHNGNVVLELSSSSFRGSAPDLGAFESSSNSGTPPPRDPPPNDPPPRDPPPNDPPPPSPDNKAPVVDAGSDKIIFVNKVSLNGSVKDDGLPQGSELGIKWSVVSGPGDVSFSSENSAKTTATFSLDGVYELRLTGDDGDLTSNDKIVIKSAKAGNGDTYTVDGDLFIEAEDFSYSYGTAAVIRDRDAEGGEAVQALDGQGTHAFADYEVITTEDNSDLRIWVRMKGPDSVGNSISIEFNGSSRINESEGVAGDNIYRWERAESRFMTDAGIWTLRIKAGEDGVIWDTIAISTDPDFNPDDGDDGGSDPLPPRDNFPVVEIFDPSNGATFKLDDKITFRGTAKDVEDGNLGAKLSWSSSLDGRIGMGATVSASSLSLGTHTIRASAEDSVGQKDTAQVRITVQSSVDEPPPSPPRSGGLVGHWTMDEGNGSTASDESGNGNHAEISGASFSNPKVGKSSLKFNGQGDYAHVPHSPSLDLSSGITLATWINPDNLKGGLNYSHIVSKNNAYKLYSHTDEAIRFEIYTRNGGVRNNLSSIQLLESGWTHIAGTYDGSMMRLYINGEMVQTREAKGPINKNDHAVYIGARNEFGYFFDGNIDDLRIYNRPLNDEEVRKLSQAR